MQLSKQQCPHFPLGGEDREDTGGESGGERGCQAHASQSPLSGQSSGPWSWSHPSRAPVIWKCHQNHQNPCCSFTAWTTDKHFHSEVGPQKPDPLNVQWTLTNKTDISPCAMGTWFIPEATFLHGPKLAVEKYRSHKGSSLQ